MSVPSSMSEWEEQIRRSAQAAMQSGIDWGNIKVAPEDVGYRFGPVLSEEEFKEHCQRTGTTPHVIRK